MRAVLERLKPDFRLNAGDDAILSYKIRCSERNSLLFSGEGSFFVMQVDRIIEDFLSCCLSTAKIVCIMIRLEEPGQG